MSDIRDYIRKRVLEINEENKKKQLEERKIPINNFRNSINERKNNNQKDIKELKDKRTEILANSSNTLKKQNYIEPQKNLFEQVIDNTRKNLTNDIGNIVENIVTGIPMGLNDFSQNINNQMYNTITDRSKITDKMRQDGLEIMMKNAKTDEEKQKIQNAMDNNYYLGSTNNLQNELKEINLKYDNKNNEYLEQINKNIDEITNPVMKRIAEVAPSVGQMVPAFLSGGTGLAYSIGSAKQSYIREAKQRGMNGEEANLYSGFMSIAEGLSDKFAIDRIGKTTGDFVKGSKALNNLKNIGINIGNNYIQEAIMRPISELVAKFTAGDEFLQYDFRTADGWNNLLKDMNNDGLNGAIMGGMLQLGTMGLTAPARIYNKMKEGKNVSNSEIKLALNEARNNGIDVDKIMADNIRQNIEQNFQNNNIQENNLPESNIKQENKQEQQIISNKNKNENMTNSALNRASISEQGQNTLIESAKKYNLNGNSEDIKGINEGLAKRNISSKFDDSFFKDNQGNIDTNTNAIWRTSKDEQGNIKREVIFNPNADTNKTIQQVAVHELWHDMVGSKEGKELADLILNRNSKQEGYKEARANLEDIYSKVYDRNSKEFKNLVDEEEVADTLAQKLGDQDFINSLNKDNPTVFKKIYDWIVDKLNKFTGGRNEKLYWEDVKNKFESVYRQEYNGDGKSKFSIQKDNNGNTYIKVDTDQNIFEGIDRKDYNKIAKMYMQDYLKGNTTLNRSDTVKVGNKGISKYTNPKQQNKYMPEKMKLAPELKNILEIAQKVDSSLPSKDTSKFPNWEYYKFNFELSGVKFEGLVNIGIDKNGQKHFYEINKIHTTSNSYISTSKSSSMNLSKNSISTSKDNVNTTDNNSMQDNVNNTQNIKEPEKGSLNLPKKDDIKRTDRLKQLRSIDTSDMGFLERSKIKSEIRALENGYNSVEEYRKAEEIKVTKAKEEYVKKQNEQRKKKGNETKIEQYKKDNLKSEQLKIIQENNPMLDNYHTGIRTIDDIKTFKEVYEIAKREANDGGWKEYASYPDITNKMIEDSLKNGEITVYSSNDIKNGTFVTPSYEQALEYAGNNHSKVKSKKVKVDDIAWINLDEGQYAKVDWKDTENNVENTKYSINDNKKDNIKYDEGTGEATYKGKTIYFRFDDKGGFKGKDHKSGVSMWEDRVDEMLFPDYDSYDDVDIAEQKIDNILEPYGLTYEEYDSMPYKEQLEVKRKIAEDEGLVTNGASVFNFSNGGLDWFKNYDMEHHETDYPEVNFFTGEITGEGADGEDVVIPDEIIATMDTKELTDIMEEVEWDDTLEDATDEEKNIEILKRVSEYINSKNNETNTKLSKQNEGAWDRFLKEHIGSNRKGKTIKSMRLPTKEDIQRMERVKSENAYTVLYDKPLVPNEDGKFRKHYKSIMNSPNLPDETRKIARRFLGSDTYVPDSNERQLKEADRRINADGADGTARTIANKLNNGDKITAEDIATGERLIQYYSKTGEWEKLQDVIQNVAMAGTEAGQTVQAFSLLRKQTPTGQAVYMRKLVDKLNKQIDKQTHGKGKKFELTDDMIQKILNSNKDNLENAIDEVTRELGQQVPKRAIEKLDSWRYFAMLFNPRTHIRNFIGNVAMGKIQGVKNKVGAGLEAVAQKTGIIKERTKTLKKASKETKEFAKSDFVNVKERITNEDKFDSRSLIRKYQRTFKSNAFEKTLGNMFNLNSQLLEKSDTFGSKRAYIKAMSDYMTANKLTPEYMSSGTKEANVSLEKARKYAVEQAQEATFRTKSSLASWLNTIEDKNVATKLIIGGIVPYKKTPINIAITGLNYSPIGVVKSFTTNLVKLNRGDITVNKYIDDLAKGLTGTGIATVGIALAQAGILSAGGDDNDKKQYYDEDRGTQTYAITIGDKTYSLDWAAPSVIPLFLGAGIYDGLIKPQEDNKSGNTGSGLEAIGKVLDSSINSLNPLVDMSMLSGVSSAIKSFSQNPTDAIGNFLLNTSKSYVNQFIPTLSRQIAKTVDDTERSTTSTEKNSFARTVDSLVKYTVSGIPIASKTLPAKTDVWGNVNKRNPNVFQRFLEQSILPWNSKTLKSTEVDKAVLDLYDITGESSALPKTSIEKEFTINGEKYRLTDKEYSDYREKYGKSSYGILKELVSSDEYKNMDNEQRLNAVSNIYKYANEDNKMDYARKNNINIESSSMYNAVETIKKDGGKTEDYFKYIGQVTGMEKDSDKLNILINSKMTSKSKSAIYSNTIGSDDENYNLFYSKTGMDINEYLKYKKESSKTGSLVSDIDEDGKVITNSKKDKVYAYVDKMNITYQQKLALLGILYKLEVDELNDLIQYIFDTVSDSSERTTILNKYKSKQGFKIKSDGSIVFK